MSDFVAGFSARQNAAAAALHQAFAPPGGFAPSGMPGVNIDPGTGPISFRPQAPTGGLGATPADNVAPRQPRHFHPASREQDPTQGWDPFAACEDVAEPAVDPITAAHASGHAEGYAEGLAAAQRQYQAQAEAEARDGRMVDSIAEALNARIDRQAMAEQLRQTVLMLVGKLVGETGIDADRLAGRIEAAIDLLSDAKEAAMLRVHPDDVAMLTDRLPQTVFPVGDAGLERGGFVLESASTIVEDGPSLWLDQLAAAIDKVPVPQC